MAKRVKNVQGSLCWLCRKAGYECRKPVEGWDADYNPIHISADEVAPSWFVRDCPEFEPDRPEYIVIPNKNKTARPKKSPKPRDESKLQHFDVFGESLTATQVCKKYNVKMSTFRTRMVRGMTPEQAAIGQRYILVGRNRETGEVRRWPNAVTACRDGLGFNPPGIHEALKTHGQHKGWIFEKKDT